MIQRDRPLPSLVSAHIRSQAEIRHIVAKLDGIDNIAHLLGFIGHIHGHRTGDIARIRLPRQFRLLKRLMRHLRIKSFCSFGHISVLNQSCTSKLSATARSNVASLRLSAGAG